MIVFLRSFTLSADREALNLAYDYHYFWQGETHHHIYRGFMDKIWSRGRAPDHDGMWLLNEIAYLNLPPESITLVDTAIWKGWARAISLGIWRSPGVLLDGKKALGRRECEALLRQLREAKRKIVHE
jgi:hypothetical protein